MATERLELVISTKGGRTVERQLISIGDTAQKAGARSQKMGDSIDRGASRGSRALRRTQNDMRRVGNEATRTSGRVTSMMAAFTVPTAAAASLRNMQRGLRGLAGAISGFYAGRYLAQAFDDFTRIQNTLKGFGVSVRSVDRVTESITKLANEARTSSVETATLFGRLRLATRELGLAESEVLELTGTLYKALRLSGSSGLEASQSVRQLSQAFNKGKLDGDEFRSVLENAPILTELLTKELNISKSELYDWAAAGKISTRVLTRAIQKGAKDIDLAFGKITPTIGDAFQQLFNNVRQFVGTTPEAGSAVGILTDAIRLLGENLNVVLGILEVYAAGFVIGKVIALFGRLTAGAKALSAAMKGVAAADALVAGSSALSGAAGAAPAGRAVGSIVSTSAQRAAAAGATALPLTAVLADSKKVQSIWKRIAGFIVAPFRSVGSIIVRIVGSAGRLLRIFNPIYLIAAAIAAKLGKGVLGSLKKLTGETSAWEAVVTTISALWEMVSTTIGGVADFMMSKISSVLKAILFLIDMAFSEALGMATVLGRLIEDPGAVLDSERMSKIQEAGRKASRAYMDSVRDGTDGIGKRLEALGAKGGDLIGDFIKPTLAKRDYDKAVAPLYQTLAELEDRVEEMNIGERLGFGPDQEKRLREFMALSLQQRQATIKGLGGARSGEGRELVMQVELLKQYDAALKSYSNSLKVIKKAVPESSRALLEQRGRAGDFGERPEDLGQLQALQNTAVVLNEYLVKNLEAFSGLEAVLREAEGSEGIEGVRKALNDVKAKIEAEADKLPPEAAQATRDAAQAMIAEAEAVLGQGAVKVAGAVRAAFVGALVPGLAGIAGGLGGANVPKGAISSPTPVPLFPGAEKIRQNTAAIDQLNQSLGGTIERLNDYANRAPSAFQRAGNAAKSTANEIQNFFQSAFGTLEDALVEFVTTGEFDFKKFINAIIADLARLVIRMLIIRPLMNFFGGLFGFGFANGGLVGEGGTLKKFSGGGSVGGVGGSTSDNQMILASRGEFVMNASAVKRVGEATLKHINNGGSPSVQRRKVGSSTINFAPHITVINEGGSGQDGQQQGEQIGTMVRQSFTELLMKETRPGGMLESVNRKGFA